MPKTSGWVVIDTSAWIHALRRDGSPEIRSRVREALMEGRAATCEMIILELLGGTRTEKENAELYADLSALQLFPVNSSVWENAYELAHALRRRGISIPPTDQIIAAVALAHSCSILHADKHFKLIEDLIGNISV